jgi:uncharacterized protein
MKHPAIPYILPFAVFVLFLALDGKLGLSPAIEYPLRLVILTAVLWVFSRHVIDPKPSRLIGSVILGCAVFVVWILPDLLFPAHRNHWLFTNFLTGAAPTPVGGYAAMSWPVLLFRSIRAVILVPIIEELFWRAWLMRWLIRPDFERVALGTFTMQSFAITALLFALEHGPFWGVGLLAGIAYNWWMVQTRNLMNCIVAHGVTNACLSGYVVYAGKWEYW